MSTGWLLKQNIRLGKELDWLFADFSFQVELQNQKMVASKPKIFLTATVTVPANSWVKLV